MKLYKFRALRGALDFALDIVLNERLYCADYRDLNDPLEGMFSVRQGPIPSAMVFKEWETSRTVDGLPLRAGETRVCSLSRPLTEMLLWSHYADEHRGIAIEIDFPAQIETLVQRVTYVDRIPRFGGSILGSPTPEQVLLHKTRQWQYEEEYRIIQKECYFPIPDLISCVYAGSRISDLHLGILKKCLPKHIPLRSTRVDWRTASVAPAAPIDRP